MGGESPDPNLASVSLPSTESEALSAPALECPPSEDRATSADPASSHRSFAAPIFRNWKRSLAIVALAGVIACTLSYVGVHFWALYHFRAGRSALDRYRSEEALLHFQSALRIWPKDSETLILASRSARQSAQYEESTRYLDTYRDIYGNDDHLSLEQVLLRAQHGNLDSVEAFCRAKLAQDDPTAPLILEALARGYIRRFQWTLAEEYMKQWLEREPENPRAFLNKGLMEIQRDNPQEAITSLRRVLQLQPENDEARLQLSELLVNATQAEEARPHLEYLRRKLPENSSVAVALARCYDQLGNQTEAEQILDEMLDRHPNHAPALFQRGRLAMRNNQPEAAEPYLRKACALDPGDLQAHYQLYQCLVKESRTTEAQEMIPRIQQIENDLKRIHELTTMQLQLSPHDPALMYEVGVILLRAGEEEQGVSWLERALVESNDKHAPTHKALADFYKKKGNARLASQHLEKAGGEGKP